MPIRRLVINFQSTIIACAYVDTLTHAYNVDKRKHLPCDTRMHMHIHTRTRKLTRLLEKGFRIWEGMVLYIKPSVAIGIHRGTLAYMYIRWDIRLECARGGGRRGRGRRRETKL